MKKALFTLSILAAFTGQSFAQLSGTYTSRLQFVLDSVCNRYHIKGTSAAVLVPGIGIWKGVNGIASPGHNVTSDMLFGIGSNTKTYMSCIMLKLQEMGKVNLDDTIGTWIQGWPNISGQITIRQCMNHTSGLYSYTSNADMNDSILADFTRIWKPEEVLSLVKAPLFAPGTNWSYSNTNYLIVGIIIKQIMAQPVNITLRDFIYTPQGLHNTILFTADATTATIADPWSRNLGTTDLEDLITTFGYSNNALFSMASTAGAIMQTAEDNAIFWHQLISGNIINNTSVNQMFQFVHIGYSGVGAGRDIGYGLGIFRYQNYMNGHTIYTHGGTNVGYVNENMVDSVTGVAISVLTNQDSISNPDLMNDLEKALHKVTITVSPTEVAEVSKPNLSVYPNPASNYIVVSLDNISHPAQLSIHDMNGKCLITHEIKENKTTISTQELIPGLYIVQLMNNGAVIADQKIQVIR